MFGDPAGLRHSGTMKWLLLLAGLAAAPATTWADPCEAPLPQREGTVFSGPVRYVGDGDSLCIGPTADPRTWIEVRLADYNASEQGSSTGRTDRERLARLTRGAALTCTAVRGRSRRVVSHDRVIARCRLRGQPLGDVLRAAGGREGGN